MVFKRIHFLGGYVKGKIPPNTFFEIDENGASHPQIFLPNKNGNPVPVLKVRMKENIGGAEQLKDDVNQWVNPRNNHHVLIYKDAKGNLKEDVVTFWTVVERKRKGFPVYQLPPDGSEIVTTLQINDMFLLGIDEEEINWAMPDNVNLRNYLFKVQTLSSSFYEFRLNTDSTQNKNTNSNVFRRIQSFGQGKTGWITHNPVKVKISVSGKIERL